MSRQNNVPALIRYAEEADKGFWFGLDKHLSETEFLRKVRDRQGYVLTVAGSPVGLLRYNLFRDNTPFCNLLYVAPSAQRRGYGRHLMAHWEAEMKGKGYTMVMTSTQADETPQHFYRKLGYADCGGFSTNGQPLELMMAKRIG